MFCRPPCHPPHGHAWHAQIGTPAYMAPELLGDAAPPPLCQLDRTDCWSVGVLTFELLVGELPFFHEVPSLLHHLVKETVVPYKVSGANSD